MNSLIRAAVTTEAEALTRIAIESKAYWGYSSDFIDSCKQELRVTVEALLSEAFTHMVIASDAGLVGFYALKKLEDNQAELDAMFVLPEHIGQGFGKRLMAHAMVHARQLGFTSLKIQSDPHAEEFYRAIGATLVGQQESMSIKGRFLSVFRIDLV